MARLAHTNTDAPTGIRKKTLKNATDLSKAFNISPRRFNQILEELGWMEKTERGWEPTKFGKKIGGTLHFFNKKGDKQYYTRWPESIILIEALREKTEGSMLNIINNTSRKESDFRKKFPAKLRTSDGHYVRSKAEVIIDDWLYNNEIIHAYEKCVPIEEAMYCDFYIPKARIYIEYWGYENKEKYLQRKKEKIDLYNKYDLNIVELNEQHVQNIDDVLPKALLKYGIACKR